MLEVPDAVRIDMQVRLEHGHRLTEVRRGHLPTAPGTDMILDSEERCHVHVHCHHERQLARQVASVAGELLLTNNQFRFVGYDERWELPWHKIVDVGADADRAIEIFATQKRGAGRYYLRDAEYVATVGKTLVRMAKRQLIGRPDTIDTAAVPQPVGYHLSRPHACVQRRVKNRRVAARSRLGVANTSMTCPYWSIARYKYTQRPATFR